MAIINARMQQKRGPLAKLDKDQLLPGEFAIPTDSDSIFVCLAAGNVIEIPSKQAMQLLLDTLNEVVKKGETIIDDFETLEVEKAAINDNETSTVTTYSSEKIMQLIDAINEFSISIVEELPTENIDDHTIYYVPKEESENDVYDEYMHINNAWEHIGSTEIDLSGYYTSTQVEEIKSELQSEIDTLNSNLTVQDLEITFKNGWTCNYYKALKVGKLLYIYLYQLAPPETFGADGADTRNQVIFDFPADIRLMVQTKVNLQRYINNPSTVEFLRINMYQTYCTTDNNYVSGATVGAKYNGFAIAPIQ